MSLQSLVCALPFLLRRHALIKSLVACFPFLRIQQMEYNDGAQAWGDLNDAFFRQYFRTKVFEPEFFDIASPFVPEGGVVFDVGANFGLCSFGLLKKKAGEGIQCHLFEANDHLVSLLKKSIALYPDESVHIHQGCISDKKGYSRLEYDATLMGSGYAVEDDEGGVPNIILDDLIEDLGIEQIDFMKLDIEGWEPYALKGCQRSLENAKVKALYVEVSVDNLKRAEAKPKDVLGFLREHGYSLYWCKPSDIERERLLGGIVQKLEAPAGAIEVVPLTEFGTVLQTDILAISDR